jgi:outer membrane protein TolC
MRKIVTGIIFAAVISCVNRALAQLPGQASSQSQPTPPAQLPLSGRSANSGSATATQTPVPGTTTSVNTLNSSIQVQGPYTGSASSVAKMPFSGRLSFHEAIVRGLNYNLGPVGIEQAMRQARGLQRTARASLLPNVNATFRENELKTDLQALGIRVPFLPAVVGPFNYFDLRATLTQTLGDMTAINNYRASREAAKSDEQLLKDARDTVVLAVGGAYLQTIAAQARVTSALAQLETAKAVYKQTAESRQAGLAAQIEVNRALVQQQTQEQRLATLRNDFSRQKINLSRLTGLPPNDKYEIVNDIGYSPNPALNVDDAVKQAMANRADLKAAELQVQAAEHTRAAARDERIPSLSISADYGVIGPRFNEGQRTYTVVGSIKVPVWDGGRIGGDVAQASAALDQRRAELEDMRGRIESDVRNAYLDLQAAANQVELSRNNQGVANETLRLTREKFEAGVSDNVEVVQAQESVASANLDYITALYAHNLAKLSLARALGNAEQHATEFLSIK